MNPDSIQVLLESALRALLLAFTVWVGLYLLRVRNVLAQKAAWGLVLVLALAMPLLMRWQWLPAYAAIRLPMPVWRQTLGFSPASETAFYPAMSTAPLGPNSVTPEPVPATRDRFPAPSVSNSRVDPPVHAIPEPTPSLERSAPTPIAKMRFPTPSTLAWLFYLAVSIALLLRLIYGLGAAVRLWRAADPVSLGHGLNLAPALRLRSSSMVVSPVTIGSGVVLPADYADWDIEKLRIVLAHERSHIRQGDFYLQLLAGLYAAIIWVSPLGWWLKRKLTDLGEAIGDRAGLEEADSRTSYAQILLEFAALPRPTLIGVAMARRSSLSHRIERLLNESSFRQAFVGSRRRSLLAVLLVSVALFAATALIKVQAAGQSAPQPPASAQTSIAGQSTPDKAPPAADAPAAPESPVPSEPSTTSTADNEGSNTIEVGKGKTLTVTKGPNGTTITQGNGPGFVYRYSSKGDSYAVVTGSGEHMTFSGSGSGNLSAEIDKARRLAHGNFLWFTRNGKSYLIDDPALVDKIEALYKPMEALGREQEELGRQQEELGKQQEKLGRLQEKASVPTPDLSREMAELNASIAKLNAKMKTTTQQELADLEGKLGDLQGKLGALQGEIGARQGAFGEQQGRLGEQQGKLGEQQGRLGEQQGRLATEADRKVKSFIDKYLSEGKARPVE